MSEREAAAAAAAAADSSLTLSCSGDAVFCIAPPPPPCDSSCRDSKVPLKVASYGNTEVIIFQRYAAAAAATQPSRQVGASGAASSGRRPGSQ